jgi:hypothetical protein
MNNNENHTVAYFKVDEYLRYQIVAPFHRDSVLEILHIPDNVTTSTVQNYLDEHTKQCGLFSFETPLVEFKFLEENYK